MQLKINIPDSEYNDLKGLYLLGLVTPTYKTFIEKICVEAIANGTPLPKGEWKLSAISEIGKDWYKCSVCGREIHTIEKMLKDYPFCHCGADMRGVLNG